MSQDLPQTLVPKNESKQKRGRETQTHGGGGSGDWADTSPKSHKNAYSLTFKDSSKQQSRPTSQEQLLPAPTADYLTVPELEKQALLSLGS